MHSDPSAPWLEVIARVRPLRDEERSAGSALTVSGSQICVEALAGSPRGNSLGRLEESFSFDNCIDGGDGVAGSATSTHGDDEQVIQDLGERFASDALHFGRDSCLIAYGQAGAGKSHTVLGLLPQIAGHLIGQQVPNHCVYFSALEISPEEELRDLLRVQPVPTGIPSSGSRSPAPAAPPLPLSVVEHPVLGVFAAGLTEVACSSPASVQELLRHCQRERAVMATSLGSSAQIHTLYMLQLRRGGSSSSKMGRHWGGVATPPSPVPVLPPAMILLADLAAAEAAPTLTGEAASGTSTAPDMVRRAAGFRPSNEGLSALHGLVRSLSHGKLHTATSSSKLSQFLGGALAGNLRTALIAALSPAWSDLEESRNTLRFAAAVGRLPASTERRERGIARLKEQLSGADVVSKLQEQVHHLREMLAHGSTTNLTSSEALAASLANWEWVLERHSPPSSQGRSFDAHLRELEAAHRRRGLLITPPNVQVIDVPHLSNISNDAQLRGALILPLRRPPASTGLLTLGCHRDCDIILSGVGIPPRLCEIAVAPGDEVTIRLLHPLSRQQPCRCTINGGLIRRGTERRVEHGDRLIFGWAHAFQLFSQDFGECFGSWPVVTEEDAVRGMNANDSETWSELSLYIEDIREKMSPDVASKFLELLGEACSYVDEGNEIMRDMRPDLNYKFDVDFVWDIFRRVQDVIVIRVIQRPVPGRKSSEGNDSESLVLFYWTYPIFCERLVAMRAAYNTFIRRGRWDGTSNPFEDPWLEASLIDWRYHLQAEKNILWANARPLSSAIESEIMDSAANTRDQRLPDPADRETPLSSGRCVRLETETNSQTGMRTSQEAETNTQAIMRTSQVAVASRSSSPTRAAQAAASLRPASSRPQNHAAPKRTKPGFRGDVNRVGTAASSSVLGIVRSAAVASGARCPTPDADRTGSATDRPRERSPPKREDVQSSAAELEKLKRDIQKQISEIARLKNEKLQEQRERKLQDEIIESLRSQISDKTELVATLRVLMHNQESRSQSSPGSMTLPPARTLVNDTYYEDGASSPSIPTPPASGIVAPAGSASLPPDLLSRSAMSSKKRSLKPRPVQERYADPEENGASEATCPLTPQTPEVPVTVATVENVALREHGIYVNGIHGASTGSMLPLSTSSSASNIHQLRLIDFCGPSTQGNTNLAFGGSVRPAAVATVQPQRAPALVRNVREGSPSPVPSPASKLRTSSPVSRSTYKSVQRGQVSSPSPEKQRHSQKSATVLQGQGQKTMSTRILTPPVSVVQATSPSSAIRLATPVATATPVTTSTPVAISRSVAYPASPGTSTPRAPGFITVAESTERTLERVQRANRERML